MAAARRQATRNRTEPARIGGLRRFKHGRIAQPPSEVIDRVPGISQCCTSSTGRLGPRLEGVYFNSLRDLRQIILLCCYGFPEGVRKPASLSGNASNCCGLGIAEKALERHLEKGTLRTSEVSRIQMVLSRRDSQISMRREIVQPKKTQK